MDTFRPSEAFPLVRRTPSAIEKAESGTKRVLSGMVVDTLHLAKQSAKLTTEIIAGRSEDWYQAGEKYHYGRSVSRDLAQAATWYRKAAEAGHTGAKYELGIVEKLAENAKSIKKSAEQGNRQAQFHYAELLSSGRYAPYIPKNPRTAFEWFQKLAQQGYPRAQFRLGQIYEAEKPNKFDDVPRDYDAAFHWYKKAAEQGHIEAQLELSSLYFRGLGVRQDYSEADKWFRRAYDQKPEEVLLSKIFGWSLSKDEPKV
jgi:TPR repeat protein